MRRLDVVVAERANISRAQAGELIGSGHVLVNGKAERKSYKVREDDDITVTEPDAVSYAAPEGVRIVYQDDDLLVVDKPAGVVVHTAPGVRTGTLVDALAGAGHVLAARGGADRPGIVHRLDRDVSGLLVVAKSDDAHESLSKALARRDIERIYVALVHGVPSSDRGKIDAPVGRDPKHRTRMAVVPDGRPAVTWFAVTERFDDLSLLEIKLETGRTHQIRTHLASIGHPIVGDRAYGRDPAAAKALGVNRPFLHAKRLAFDHPATGARVDVTSELPADLEAALGRLRA